jgi:hypothetical protein
MVVSLAPTQQSCSGGAGRTQTSEDGSEVPSPVQRPVSLELLSQFDVTPAGEQAHRPDVVAVGGELWLAFVTVSEGFMLQRFDAELNAQGPPIRLASLPEMPTDIRTGLVGSRFWSAFETVAPGPSDCGHHFLNAAEYAEAKPPQLSRSASHLAAGCATDQAFMENPTGLPEYPELVDDPTPFLHHGVRYILTRAWPGPGARQIHHLRRLDEQLQVAEDVLLDTDAVLPGHQMSQNVLIHVNEKPYLVSGFPTGMPVAPNTSSLYLLPLSDDLRSSAGQPTLLGVQGVAYAERVTRARHVNGTLILNFIYRYVGSETREFLALFDVRAGFAMLSQIQVQDHQVVDNHSSFEVIGDRLYLFQQQDGEKLSAKIFRLRS